MARTPPRQPTTGRDGPYSLIRRHGLIRSVLNVTEPRAGQPTLQPRTRRHPRGPASSSHRWRHHSATLDAVFIVACAPPRCAHAPSTACTPIRERPTWRASLHAHPRPFGGSMTIRHLFRRFKIVLIILVAAILGGASAQCTCQNTLTMAPNTPCRIGARNLYVHCDNARFTTSIRMPPRPMSTARMARIRRGVPAPPTMRSAHRSISANHGPASGGWGGGCEVRRRLLPAQHRNAEPERLPRHQHLPGTALPSFRAATSRDHASTLHAPRVIYDRRYQHLGPSLHGRSAR